MKHVLASRFSQAGRLAATALVVAVAICGLLPNIASASVPFNPSNLMDDSVFDNSSSMSAGQIDSWLNNNFPNSCISTNHGFQAPLPTGYSPSSGFSYGGNVSAGTVIATSAQVYGLNPQVLLAMLQKEQGLVSGDVGCSVNSYVSAVSYSCNGSPNRYSYSGLNLYTLNGVTVTSVSNSCVSSSLKAGFSQQIIHAAWLLKWDEQRSEGNTGWAVITGSWDNSDDNATGNCYGGAMTQGYRKRCPEDTTAIYYDGYSTIEGTSIHIDTGASASLYRYDPSFSGNQSFDNIYNAWYGSVYGNAIESAARRMWNPSTYHHDFVANENDRVYQKQQGYVDDFSSAFNVGPSQGSGMIPIYRLYNGALHDNWFLPDGPALYWGAVYGGYGIQGVAFYAYPINPSPTPSSPLCQAGTVPVMQMWNPGHADHMYSIYGIDHYYELIYGGYVDDGSSLYKDANGGVSYCVPQ